MDETAVRAIVRDELQRARRPRRAAARAPRAIGLADLLRGALRGFQGPEITITELCSLARPGCVARWEAIVAGAVLRAGGWTVGYRRGAHPRERVYVRAEQPARAA